MPNNYDGNYPQYQFYNGGPMEQPMWDQKYLNDGLINKLFQTQAQQQILSAFTPAGGAPSGPAAGGASFLDQLLNGLGTSGAPAAPASNPLFPSWGTSKPTTPAAPTTPVNSGNASGYNFTPWWGAAGRGA